MGKMTIKEIARECKVSQATVSNVLNGKPKVSEETKNQILKVMEEYGYQPNNIAQGLRRKKTKTIGIIVEDIRQFTSPMIIDGVMRMCEENGYKTVVQNLRLYSRWSDYWFDNNKMVDSVLTPAFQELKNIMVDGIIYIAGHARKIQFPGKMDIPLVLCYAYSQDNSVPSVVLDDEESAYRVVQHLVKMGHRNIGIIAGEEDNLHTQLRIRGCQRGFFDAGILYNPANVLFAGWDKVHGYKAAKTFLERDITAIICMNDRVAGGVYKYCYEHNIRVGEDISIMGMDNEILADYYTPGLTTMELPLVKIGTTATSQLLKMLEAEEDEEYIPEEVIGLPAEIVQRKSVVNLTK